MIITIFLHHSPLLSLPTVQQNLLILPPLPSSIINCTFLADTPNQQWFQTQATSINVQKSLSHSFLYWLQFFSWQQGLKEIAKLDSKQISLEGLGREQGVSICSASGVPVMPLNLSLGWLCNKIIFFFLALSFAWKDALIWSCCSNKKEGDVATFQLHAVCLHHHSSFLQPPLPL